MAFSHSEQGCITPWRVWCLGKSPNPNLQLNIPHTHHECLNLSPHSFSLSLFPSPLSPSSLSPSSLSPSFPLSLFPFSRLLKDDCSFSFVPRSQLELPDNFPKDIPGTCYFLEGGTSHSHASLTSSRSAPPAPLRKVSYSIGTMFLRETSL